MKKKKTVADYPHLVKEWHPTFNGELRVEDVTHKSGKKAWWICHKNQNHIWNAKVCNRTNGNACPYCAGKKVCQDNCLQTLKPEISSQWHPTKNGKLTAKDVTIGSTKMIWWQCKKNKYHVWQASVNTRTSGHDCPYCRNQKICKDNCLATLDKKIASEWHPTKNGILTAQDVALNYTKRVWWQCNRNKNHIWKTTVNHRAGGQCCPYCSNKKVCKDNCLQTVNPELASEWHPTKNGKLKPTDVTVGSDKKVWWKCKKNENHVWLASVDSRTRGTCCPFCNISRGEERIENFLQLHKIEYKREKRFKDCKNKRLLPFDFYLPEFNCLIEYNGEQHYKPIRFSANWDLEKAKEKLKIRKQHDRIKKAWAKKKGIRLIVIKYTDFDSIEFILKELV